MYAKMHSLNEDRGARRAADLRRRFAHVSDAAISRPATGRRNSAQARVLTRSRKAQLTELLGWSTLATVMVFIGFLVL
ncbi:hypothetical protein [Roseibium sp. M-1]